MIDDCDEKDNIDDPSKEEIWIKHFGLIQLFAGISDRSTCVLDEEATSCENAGEMLATIHVQTMGKDLYPLLIKACVNYLIDADNEYICIISTRIIVNLLKDSYGRSSVGKEYSDMLGILFSASYLLVNPSYLSWSFEIVLCVIRSHPLSQRHHSLEDLCSECGVVNYRCLAFPFMDVGGQELICVIADAVNTVLVQSLDVDLICKAWSLCYAMLRK